MIIRTYNTFELELDAPSEGCNRWFIDCSLVSKALYPWVYRIYTKYMDPDNGHSISSTKYLTIEEAVRQLDFPSKLRYKNHKAWIV